MTLPEYDKYKSHDNLIIVQNLKNKSDRTLLYGYTIDRKTVHLYLKDKEFHYLVYEDYTNDNVKTFKYTLLGKEIKYIYNFIPSKRAYPECCDIEFSYLIKKAGYDIPFTGFNELREVKQFYGKLYPEIKDDMVYPPYNP